MGGVIPSEPGTITYGGSNLNQSIVEMFQNADIQKTMDVLDSLENIHVETIGDSAAALDTPFYANFNVPAGSTVLLLSCLGSVASINNSSVMDCSVQRIVRGQAVNLFGASEVLITPALPAISQYLLRVNGGLELRGMLLWNPDTVERVGLRTLAIQRTGVVGGSARIRVRAIVFSGNPFNAKQPVV